MGKHGGPSSAVLMFTAALAAVFIFRSGNAEAAQPSDGGAYPPAPPPPPDDYVSSDENPGTSENEDMSAQLDAFLFMVRNAEHTPAAVRSNSDYGTAYGGVRFYTFSDHPIITGEIKGYPLTDSQCRGAGFGPGCVSTAAGAYQIIRPTWDKVRRAGSWGDYLPDFSASSQDEAARRIMLLCGALGALEARNFKGAVSLASRQWASLPGSTAKQGPKSLETVTAFFAQAGGITA